MLAANGLQLYSSLETCSLLTEPTTLRDALLFSHSVVSDSLWHLWTVAHQALCPWDSPGKNTGVGCHALLRGNLPNPGIKPESLESPALAGGFFTTESSVKPQRCLRGHIPNQHSQWVTGIKEHRASPFASRETTLVPSCSWALYGIKADARPLLKPLLCLASFPAFPASSPSFLKGFSWEHSFSKNPSLLICFSTT